VRRDERAKPLTASILVDTSEPIASAISTLESSQGASGTLVSPASGSGRRHVSDGTVPAGHVPLQVSPPPPTVVTKLHVVAEEQLIGRSPQP
jgi:hypothetical protein